MKKRILLLTAIFLMSVACVAAQTKNKTTEPTAKEAVKLILSNGDIPLSINSTCKDVGSSRDDKTILDYLSGLLSFQTEPDSANKIEFTFKQEKGKRGEILWVCDLMFLGKSGEETEWSWGVRFTMRDSDRKLLRETVTCTGSG